MKKRLLAMVTILAMAVCAAPMYAAYAEEVVSDSAVSVWDGSLSDGSWRVDFPNADVYEIWTANQLANLANMVRNQNNSDNGDLTPEQMNFTGKTVKLMADIDLNGDFANDGAGGKSWAGIGTSSAPFKGTFDGQGHTISNICVKINVATLFGRVEGTVENLGVENLVFTATAQYSATGGIALWVGNDTTSAKGVVRNCCVKNLRAIGTDGNNYNVGGIARGICADSIIENCYVSNVKATKTTAAIWGGGICYEIKSWAEGGKIANCYVNGFDSPESTKKIVGWGGTNTVENSYVTGYTNMDNSSWGVAAGSVDEISAKLVTADSAFKEDIWSHGAPLLKWENKVYVSEEDDAAQVSVWDGTMTDGSWRVNFPDAEVYEIWNAQQLANLANMVRNQTDTSGGYTTEQLSLSGKTVKLMTDIDLNGDFANNGANGKNWAGIGESSKPFKGTFDGQGHTISNISSKASGIALFGRVLGRVENLGVEDYVYNVTGNWATSGGIAAFLGNTGVGGTIRNCYAKNLKTSVAGANNYNFGGIAGKIFGTAKIENCYVSNVNAAKPDGATAYLGGICYNPTDAIEGCAIKNCYANGFNSNGSAINTISAWGGKLSVNNCFAAGYTTTPSNAGTYLDSVDALKTEETLTKLGSGFKADPANLNDGYPVLAWQKAPLQAQTAPTGIKVTGAKKSTVTMTEIDGAEYAISAADKAPTEWQDSNVFTGLAAGSYKFYARMKAKEGYKASDSCYAINVTITEGYGVFDLDLSSGTLTASFDNNLANPVSGAAAIAAVYDGDTLTDAKTVDITVTSKTAAQITIDNLSVNEGSSVKLFIWNSAAGMIPVIDAVPVTE